MGIKNLHSLLREVSPKSYTVRHLSYYSFKRVSIDVSLFLCKYKCVYGDIKWKEAFINLILSLRRNNVHGIFIFDSGCVEDKLIERARRQEARDKLKDKSILVAGIINKLKLNEVLNDEEKELINKKLFEKRSLEQEMMVSRLLGNTKEEKQKDVEKPELIKILQEYLDKLDKQNVKITPEDIDECKNIFNLFKIPFYHAPLEAETLCALLVKSGIAVAALSEDTDLLAYGVPIFMHKINTYNDTFTEIVFDELLESINFTYPQFLDLCIMCGTDYNSNIPKIGSKTAHNLLSNYNCIEKVLECKDLGDGECLRYKRCRELFTDHKLDKMINYNKFCGKPDFQSIIDYFNKNNIYISRDKIVQSFFRPNEIIFND